MQVEELQAWLTITQAAERLGVSRPTIHERLQRGTLAGVHLPVGWLLHPDLKRPEGLTGPKPKAERNAM